MSAPRRAAGVLLPLALLVAACAGTDPEEVARTSPSPTVPERTTTAPLRPTAWVDGLPVGEPPRIGYVLAHTYHSPSGRIVRFPSAWETTWLTPLGDGWLVVDDRYFEGTAGLHRLDARGRRAGELGAVAGPPALSADGRTLRWITFAPPEASPSEREPTRLHVADVATGRILSRVIERDVERLPSVPQRSVRRAGLALPHPRLRAAVASRAWEGRHHLLVAVLRARGREAAIARYDVRTRAWELAVDWSSTAGSAAVVFES